MRRRHSLLIVILLILSLSVSGCLVTGSTKVNKESFKKSKKYALVTIFSGKEFFAERGMLDAFKDVDEIKGANTQPILDKLVPSVRTKLAKTGYFHSMPMKRIVNSKAYKDMAEDEKSMKIAFMKVDYNVGRGYKYFKDMEKLKKLASDLGVDGVIIVGFEFHVTESSWVIGFVGKKKYYATCVASVTAVDKDGNVVWKDATQKAAESADKKNMVLVELNLRTRNLEKLHPSAVKVGEHAIDVLVERLHDTMEGKKTSAFQVMRDKKSKEATKTDK